MEELSSEEVGEEKERGRSQPRSAENENAGTNDEPEEVEAKNTKLADREKFEFLKELHGTPIEGHIGTHLTYKGLEQNISWEGMKEDVETFH
jgi:hypothetical protein